MFDQGLIHTLQLCVASAMEHVLGFESINLLLDTVMSVAAQVHRLEAKCTCIYDA